MNVADCFRPSDDSGGYYRQVYKTLTDYFSHFNDSGWYLWSV
jgi:hypothetical protein